MVLPPTDPNMAQAWISGTPPDQTIDFYIPRGNMGPIGPRGPIGPSLVVGNIETVTGPAAPGTVGAQGLTGPKGDPGGFTSGTLLGAADLNTIKASGIYRQPEGIYATFDRNYPRLREGVLTVLEVSGAGYVVQEFTPFNDASRAVYRREFVNPNWSPWRVYSSQRVDQTAGRAIYQWDDVNNREQLIWGDTGWRNLNTTVDANFVPEGVGVQIRRNGNRVTCDVRGRLTAVPADGISQLICALPVGFRGANYNMYPAGVRGVSVLSLGGPGDNINLYMYSTLTFVTATTHITQASWVTDETWPTTLPGTAVGTIPNV